MVVCLEVEDQVWLSLSQIPVQLIERSFMEGNWTICGGQH